MTEGRIEGGHRRIRLCMVGGGPGAMIGGTHRVAARLADEFELVAGAFSADPDTSLQFGRGLGLPDERCYGSYEEMAARESARADGAEAVTVVTPNHLHFPVAKVFLEAGLHVICDKPLTSTLEDARALAGIVERSGRVFVLTHNYSAYPMVRQARDLVAEGAIGEIRFINAEYASAFLARPIERSGNKQAEWRTEPARSGAGGTIADLGTHAYHLACYVTGLSATRLAAELAALVEGRAVDDNAQVMLRFPGNVRGNLWVSHVAAGEGNNLTLRVYGTEGSLSWEQENPNVLVHRRLDGPRTVYAKSEPGSGASAADATHLPAGHPEGYYEAFANIYIHAARAIRAFGEGRPPEGEVDHPTVADGVAGMAFIEACVQSSRNDGAWTACSADGAA